MLKEQHTAKMNIFFFLKGALSSFNFFERELKILIFIYAVSSPFMEFIAILAI